MRVVFMGTPEIAATCLEGLLTGGFDVVAVYTKPDTPQNRGMKLTQSPVKQLAQAHGVPVYQPAGFRDAARVEELRALKPDVIAVVAYGRIFLRPCWIFPPGAASTFMPACCLRCGAPAPCNGRCFGGWKRPGSRPCIWRRKWTPGI